MIPPILHQTWKTDDIPDRFRGWVESWERYNPGWTRMFWNDRALLDFVAEHYPDFLETFCSYKLGILRADAGRYMLLHHFGGIYADLDCECVAPFDAIMDEDRVVLCKEPALHTQEQTFRGLPHLLFNGTMASPPGHPFWMHLLSYLPGLADSIDVLDATGPCVLTSAQLSFPDQASIAIHPSTLFAPLDRDGVRDQSGEAERVGTLSVHHWAGTWVDGYVAAKWKGVLKKQFYRTRYLLTRGEQANADELRSRVDASVISKPVTTGSNVALLVPLRDAAQHVRPFLTAIQALDYPAERIKLVFCEGDSTDGTWEVLCEAVEPLRRSFRDVVLLQDTVGIAYDREKRYKPRLQRKRRSAIAKVRNHLARHGLDESDDWALWIDVDVWKFPSDIVSTLIAQGRKIVAPNCVKVAAGPSFDRNSFVATRFDRDYRYYRSVAGGVYQPSEGFFGRRHLSDLRHLDRVDLHGVGGTMLLVDAALHRGGLLFPEKPYKDLLETEAFGVLARDLGVTPLGLPRVEIFHVPW
ncbi:glycosyltransferase [Mesorhizobium marinum]|uniref:Glycosyltransferase n=1 Tax=Mesorhizobium marinum TaxID=3228790 RepID=A0ABV3QXI9_9HYPH